ncbi:hypothetical protein Lalb_Chr17g0346121 [Lupinus albus]|uniref:Uncharacterized protein n=1 Tax=Lupinus albus TaxID=3870 RepID=A0A6A4P8J5_LUPAL|nr:hypothetical protein Lalb_Chr17g0346121 [Lupinus albus]
MQTISTTVSCFLDLITNFRIPAFLFSKFYYNIFSFCFLCFINLCIDYYSLFL